MRWILDFDKTKNVYIAKLEQLYNVNPRCFYSLIDVFLDHEYQIGEAEFSHKTECLVRSPDIKKIYPATISQPCYQLFVLSNEQDLLNAETLKKYIMLIITRQRGFPHILIITDEKHKQQIKQQIEQYLPQQTDELCYTVGVITDQEFNNGYKRVMCTAIEETMHQMQNIINNIKSELKLTA